MSHQDWNTVVFKKKQSVTLTNDDIRRSNYKTTQRVVSNSISNTNMQKLHKIDNETEAFDIKKISLSLSRQIQSARLNNKMSQKELALKINVSVKIINDYESCKAMPDNRVKMKIQRALGVVFNQ